MSNTNAARAKARAKADPKASSEKAARSRRRKADRRSEDAKTMRRQGASVDEIKRVLGVSRRTVYNLLAREYESPDHQMKLLSSDQINTSRHRPR